MTNKIKTERVSKVVRILSKNPSLLETVEVKYLNTGQIKNKRMSGNTTSKCCGIALENYDILDQQKANCRDLQHTTIFWCLS